MGDGGYQNRRDVAQGRSDAYAERMPLEIRDYDPSRDLDALRSLVVDLQDHERDFAPESFTGEAIVDAYVPYLLERALGSGRVLMADEAGVVVGFVAIVVSKRFEPDDPDEFHVEVAELSVTPEARGRGIGRTLVDAAVEHARAIEAPTVRLRVDARNRGARRFYEREGFLEKEIVVARRLTPVGSTSRPSE
jgi:ribosomal protein S18 acetylase RimI-like enzyme